MMDTNESAKFHREFDECVRPIVEAAREVMLETSLEVTREAFVARIMLDNLFPNHLEPELANGGDPCKIMTTEQKKFLVGIAGEIGPDWAQALYRAAVFITRVA